MKFIDLRVKTKLMLGFACVAAIVLLVSALSLHSLGVSNDRFSSYLAGVGTRERLAGDVRSAATRRAIAARNLVLVTEPKDVELEKATVLQARDEVRVSLDKLAAAVAQAGDAKMNAESLKLQAAGLLNLVAAFKTADTHGAAFA